MHRVHPWCRFSPQATGRSRIWSWELWLHWTRPSAPQSGAALTCWPVKVRNQALHLSVSRCLSPILTSSPSRGTPPRVLTPLITTQLSPSHLTFSPQFRIHHHISMHQLPLSLWHRDLCNPTPLSKNKMPGRNGLLKNKEVLERHCQRGILQVRQGQGFRGWRLICVCCKRRASVTFHWEILRKFHFQICLVATQQSQNPIIVLILLSEGHFRKNSNDNSCLLRTEQSYSVENWWADLRSLFASVALLPVSRRWGNWIPGPSGSLTSSFYSSRQY